MTPPERARRRKPRSDLHWPLEAYTRVGMSPEGIRLFRDASKTGTVVGGSKDPECVRVIWDGQKTPAKYHVSFLQVIPERPE